MNAIVRRIAPTVAVALQLCAWTGPAFADTPTNLRHADFKPATTHGTLDARVKSLLIDAHDGDWIGYAVKPLRNNTICSGNWNNGRLAPARLEHDEDGMSTTSHDEDEDGFAIERDMYILLRSYDHRIDRIRLITSDCDVNASGSTIHWLGDALGAESIALLADLATRRPSGKQEREKLNDRSVCAIALHEAREGLRTLQNIFEKSEDGELRSNLAFWIGQTGRDEGLAFLRDALHDDPSAEVREQIIFAISQDESPRAVDALIDIARNDSDPDLRGKALFWLSQKASHKAGETLRDAAINDPDLDVKEQAVFALSQLSPDEGIPMLIDVARNNPHPKIRENAIFWLGQSDDPRVLTFFEQILSR